MYDCAPNTPLELFVQNALRNEPAIVPDKKCFGFAKLSLTN